MVDTITSHKRVISGYGENFDTFRYNDVMPPWNYTEILSRYYGDLKMNKQLAKGQISSIT